MNLVHLKNNLHRMVVETEDPEILAQIAAYFSSMLGERKDRGSLLQEENITIEPGEAAPQSGLTIRYSEIREKARDILGSL